MIYKNAQHLLSTYKGRHEIAREFIPVRLGVTWRPFGAENMQW